MTAAHTPAIWVPAALSDALSDMATAGGGGTGWRRICHDCISPPRYTPASDPVNDS